MDDKFTLFHFLKTYSNDDKCLEAIKNIRWPNGITCPECGKITKFYKVKRRKAYACEFGGHQVFPLAGTVFEKSSTPLRSWFYAMFLMIKTKSGISAKQLERELGVTYKTAWRMFRQIRILMADMDITPLEGDVEIDETFIGGKGQNRMNQWHGNEKPKEIVMGMVQREGKAYLKHIKTTGKWALIEQINKFVSPKARIMTDEAGGYIQLKKLGYNHYSVNHSLQQYAIGDIYTQNAENVWSHLKRGIYGVYRHVSKKYLQAYVDEFAFRYNNRRKDRVMFNTLLSQLALVKMVK